MTRKHDDYLWDRTGEDPEVERLERLLAPLAHDPARRSYAEAPDVPRPGNRAWPLALTAGLAALAAGAIATVALWAGAGAHGPSWTVEVLAGHPTCGGASCRSGLRVGDWLETGPGAEAVLAVADIGTMRVAADSRLRLAATGAEEHRLELARGRIEASVNAPPRMLFVDTPSATAVDLGCAYTLEVAEDGGGVLDVTSGVVALEHDGRTSVVPAGARALTLPGVGPGTPWFVDADPELAESLYHIDFGTRWDSHTVDAVLALARARDTLSLVHLLERVSGDDRVRVLDRIEALAPTEVARGPVLALETAACTQLLEDVAGTW